MCLNTAGICFAKDFCKIIDHSMLIFSSQFKNKLSDKMVGNKVIVAPVFKLGQAMLLFLDFPAL
jgi:hypothetical protein